MFTEEELPPRKERDASASASCDNGLKAVETKRPRVSVERDVRRGEEARGIGRYDHRSLIGVPERQSAGKHLSTEKGASLACNLTAFTWVASRHANPLNRFVDRK
jgi:hypothetical protein